MKARKQKAAEVAMRRRRGASKAHSDKVRMHMLSHADLYTTCQACGQPVRGALVEVLAHTENCDGT